MPELMFINISVYYNLNDLKLFFSIKMTSFTIFLEDLAFVMLHYAKLLGFCVDSFMLDLGIGV